MADEQEQNITLSQKELGEFIDALRETLIASITENNTQAMVSLFDRVFPPLLERMDHIAMAQLTLANALKTNRRDNNATRFAELLIERAMRTPDGLDQVALHTIPTMAYALANEMDLHGRVAEVQAADKDKRMDEAAASAPKFASSKELVDNFFGRKPVEVPKVQAKKGAGGKKH